MLWEDGSGSVLCWRLEKRVEILGESRDLELLRDKMITLLQVPSLPMEFNDCI